MEIHLLKSKQFCLEIIEKDPIPIIDNGPRKTISLKMCSKYS